MTLQKVTTKATLLSCLAALGLGTLLWLGASRTLIAEDEKPAAAAAPAAMPARDAPPVRRAAILLFEGVQIIDYTGPYEVFGQAGYEVYTVAARREPLTTAMGMTVTPRYTLADAPPAEVLVVPGGNVEAAIEDPRVLDWLRARSPQAKVVLSVCNGAFVLAESGLLDGLSATTYAPMIPDLRERATKTRVVDDVRFVDNGKVITSAGLSSGIDGSLHVVEKLLGRGRAQVIATNLEYDWDPEGRYVRAQLADLRLRGAYDAIRPFERTPLLHQGDRDRWETRWRVTADLPAADLAARLGAGLESAGWKRSAADGGWTLADAKGGTWNGEVTVAPAPGEAGAFEASVRIARAGAAAAAR